MKTTFAFQNETQLWLTHHPRHPRSSAANFWLLLLLAILLLAPSFTSVANAAGYECQNTLDNNLNVRDAPSGSVIGALAPNQTVTSGSGADGDWVEIQYEGQLGYASAQYLECQAIPDPTATPTTVAPAVVTIADPEPTSAPAIMVDPMTASGNLCLAFGIVGQEAESVQNCVLANPGENDVQFAVADANGNTVLHQQLKVVVAGDGDIAALAAEGLAVDDELVAVDALSNEGASSSRGNIWLWLTLLLVLLAVAGWWLKRRQSSRSNTPITADVSGLSN